MTAACIIATYGDDLDYWDRLAERAQFSAYMQTEPFSVVARSHADTLAEARNSVTLLPAMSKVDYYCFLDADDTLDYQYHEAMNRVSGDIKKPWIQYGKGYPSLLPEQDLRRANHIPIGAFVRRDLFHYVEGFHELDMLEDWDLWLRCWLEGAEIVDAPGAIYEAWPNEDPRNAKDHRGAYATITQSYGRLPRSKVTWSERTRDGIEGSADRELRT